MVVEIERERLPEFVLEAQVEGGHRAHDRREEQIGRASGYEGSQREQVDVNGGFRLRVLAAYTAPIGEPRKNSVRSQARAAGTTPADSEPISKSIPPSGSQCLMTPGYRHPRRPRPHRRQGDRLRV
ncbi:MAG: hypothetical protein IPO88_07975 [Nannocystis sp.]|uniref:hypothetical protein n=1 Tax=Nannocystis sp. TaxID=1962667 RepID=UPI002425E829|nr:hypothetical protein [Nannocystis sp.]MBK9753431.1 hypothetical protein [Nannocystis sp.]